MCMINKRKANVNVKVLKWHVNRVSDVMIELTEMTAISGTIVYAVIVRRRGRGHYRIYKYTRLGRAWKQYKAAIA